MQPELPSLAAVLSRATGCVFQISATTSYASRLDGVVILNTAEYQIGALCSFWIPKKWHACAPHVTCYDHWFRRGEANWHSYKDGGLCWDLAERWCGHLSILSLKISPADLAVHASEYLLNSVRSLLQRHFVGHQLGLKDWPPDWADWAHGNAGRSQFITSLKNEP